jgi:uncharacterized protein (DUF1330 family)
VAIDPTGQDLKQLMNDGPDGPIVMLNLLRFRPEGGRARYDEYARELARNFLPRYGGEVLYAGDGHQALVAEDGQAWDAVLCVRYPDRASFLAMVADPEYQRLTHLRTEALVEATLQPTTPW